jgi:hypothetical protein
LFVERKNERIYKERRTMEKREGNKQDPKTRTERMTEGETLDDNAK